MIHADWLSRASVDVSDRAERALLGVLLYDAGLMSCCGTLRPADFRSPERGSVFAALGIVQSPDIITVASELTRQGVEPPRGTPGWCTALASLLDEQGIAIEAHVAEYARIVREAALTRRTERRLRAAS